MRNNKLLIAIGAGVATFVLFFIYFKAKENSLLSKAAVNRVIVAAKYIAPGALLTADMLKEVEYPEMYVQPGAVRTTVNAAGYLAAAAFSENEQILANKLTKVAEKLSEIIPIGYRAVSIAVDDTAGLGGMAKPGDYVDVIGAFEDAGNRGVFSATVIQYCQLLAFDGDFSGNRKKDAGLLPGPVGRSNATLLVEPADAEALAFAENKGRLRLSLRNPGDAKYAQLKTTSFSNLLRNTARENPKPQEGPLLEIIRGTDGEKVRIK